MAKPATPLARLEGSRGCLADRPPAGVPVFQLDANTRASLREALAFLNATGLSLPTAPQRLRHGLFSFRCTLCHERDGVGGVKVGSGHDAFFTSNGEDLGDEGRLPPNLDGAGDRLRPAWLAEVLGRGAGARTYLNTRMPAFWPGGVSPLPAVLSGDTTRQMAALWVYLAEGSRALFPEGMSPQSAELVVGSEPVVYRGKLWEAGFRALAVGYPGGVNAAYDAEEMRWALLWRGRFLNAGPHWGVQGMGRIRPPGTDLVVLAHGPELAVLADAEAPWPVGNTNGTGVGTGGNLEPRFRGYELDAARRPILRFRLGGVEFVDFLEPLATAGKPGFRRTLRWEAEPPPGLWFRAATGTLSESGGNRWRAKDGPTVRVVAGRVARVRGPEGKQELRLEPVGRAGRPMLEIEYEW